MSILIEGMTMPESCSRCPMYNNCAGHDLNPLEDVGRGEHCPLVPVPPHGRSIDADELIEFIENQFEITWKHDYKGGYKDACVDILRKIFEMPTIISAEEDEK